MKRLIVVLSLLALSPSYGFTVAANKGSSATRTESPKKAPRSEPAPAPALEPEIKVEPETTPNDLDEKLSPRVVTLAYSGAILGIAIPFKHGPNVAWIANPKWTFEIGHFAGSYSLSSSFLNIGSFKESLLTLNARRYVANSSFNFIMGLSRHSYEAKLGDDIIARAGGPGAYTVLAIDTVGLQLGVGNRWHRGGWMFGVDWIALNFPFASLKTESDVLKSINNSNDRQTVEDAIKIMRYLPTGAICKASIGYSF